MTAALGLYQQLSLPLPWNPTNESIPLVIYGGATAVGAFAIKFAQLSNIHPLIVVAGRGRAFVETIIESDKGDVIIDYRDGDEAVRENIKAAAGNKPIHYAFDAVSEKGSYENIGETMTAPGQLLLVLPGVQYRKDGIVNRLAIAGSIHFPPTEGKTISEMEFGAAFLQLMGRGLSQGWFSGHPFEVRPGGLAGIQDAMSDLRDGKVSALKYVFRIGETVGAEHES